VMDAANAIAVGEYETVIAGGMESMSNAPHLLERSRTGIRMGEARLSDSMVKDGLWDPYHDQHMGTCAEECAKRFGFSREDQDEYALTSYRRAQAAMTDGCFNAEIAITEVPQRKGEPLEIAEDQEPHRSPLDKMDKLRPVFSPEGTITAANASKINDGAAALMLTTAENAECLTLHSLARVVGYSSVAQDPVWFTTAPPIAIRKCLQRTGLSVGDIDRWEINEAFAVVTMAATQTLGIDPERVNTLGGAVALGHPIGCSGARIIVTLLSTLLANRERYGCASLCIGGGEATALIIENLTI